MQLPDSSARSLKRSRNLWLLAVGSPTWSVSRKHRRLRERSRQMPRYSDFWACRGADSSNGSPSSAKWSASKSRDTSHWHSITTECVTRYSQRSKSTQQSKLANAKKLTRLPVTLRLQARRSCTRPHSHIEQSSTWVACSSLSIVRTQPCNSTRRN